MLGMTPADFFSHDVSEGRRLWRDFFDNGRLHINTRERRADGTFMWVEGDYICIRDEEGRILGHFGMQRDVTHQVEAKQRLAASERRLRLIADNMPALLSYTGSDLRYRFNNRM